MTRLAGPAAPHVSARRGLALSQRDWPALLVLALLFGVMLVATWQRWTHPIIDHGREMNLPSRILAGEVLYLDIHNHYGPFAPHFNALLYRLFGVHLNTLHASGMACAVLVLIMIYWLARRVLRPWEAATAAGLVLVTCALAANLGNYIQPYSYAALYGWTFALASLVCLVRFMASHRPLWMFAAGLCIGLTVTCKPELCVLGVLPAAVAWTIASMSAARWQWRALWPMATATLAIVAVAYVPIVVSVPWDTLVTDTYRAFGQPQMRYFTSHLNGMRDWPATGWALLAGSGMLLAASGLAALLGLLLDAKVQSLWRRPAWVIWICIVGGAGLWSLEGLVPGHIEVTPLRSAPLVLGAMIAVISWRLWRRHSRCQPLPRRDQVLLLFSVFSLIAIGRVILNLSLWTPYTMFTVPTVMVLYCYLFFRVAPAWLLSSRRAREYARVIAMVLVTISVVSLGVKQVELARVYNDYELSSPRGRMWVAAALGRPLDEAVRFAVSTTRPGDYVLSLPQGTIINFLADRRNPMREEVLVPGLVSPEGEAEAIRRVAARRVELILVANHLTPEYRERTFGVDYHQEFMRWIEAHYHPVATFRAAKGRELRFGDRQFFIRAYQRNVN